MIKKFEMWLVESQQTAEQFIQSFTAKLIEESIPYSIESSDRQLKNGTLELSIDVNSSSFNVFLHKTFEFYGLQASDFSISVEKIKQRLADTRAFDIIVYKKGSVRVKGASSDNISFTNDENGVQRGVDWIKAYWSNKIAMIISHDIKLESVNRFKDYKIPNYDLDLELVKKYFDDNSFRVLNNLKQKYPDFFKAASKEILFVACLASMNKTTAGARTYEWESPVFSRLHMYIMSGKYEVVIRERLTISKTLKVKLDIFESYPDHNSAGRTPQALLIKKHIKSSKQPESPEEIISQNKAAISLSKFDF